VRLVRLVRPGADKWRWRNHH